MERDGGWIVRNDGITSPEGSTLAYGPGAGRHRALEALGVECGGVVEPTELLVDEWQTPDRVVHDYLGVEQLDETGMAALHCLLECLPRDPDDWHGPALAAGRVCFDVNAAELAVEVGVGQTWDVILSMLRAWPNLSFFCHSAGHRLGRAAVIDGGMDVDDVLRELSYECIGGGLHGATDALAESGRIDLVPAVVEACVERENGDTASGFMLSCSDGVGHAAWDLTDDLGRAAALCGLFGTETARGSCDGGVIMRWADHNGMYTQPGLEGYRAYAQDVVDLCSAWERGNTRELLDGEGPGDGCHLGAQYLLWTSITLAVRHGFDGEWRRLPDMEERLRIVGATCAQFGDRGNGLCRDSEASPLLAVAQFDRDDALELCGLLLGRVEECAREVNESLGEVNTEPK